MLYKTSELPKKNEGFLFISTPYNEDIDLYTIGAYQIELFENGYLQEEHAKELLNYAIYYARKNVIKDKESPYFSSFQGKGSPCASILDLFFKKLGLSCFQFNIGPTLGEENCQQLCFVEIPIHKNDEIEIVSFLLDPTFRQFCLKEENRFERFFEEPRGQVKKSSPHPGYFLSLSEKGTQFANDLITYGYFEATDEKLKTYCDAFALYFMPKDKYENKFSIGKISSTFHDGAYYKAAIYKNKKSYHLNLVVETPIETLYQNLNKGMSRFDKVNKILLKKYRILIEKIRVNEMNSYSINENA